MPESSPQAATTISFLTFNIFADLPRFAHMQERLELQAAAIARLRPDAAALQELVRSPLCGDLSQRLCHAINQRPGGAEYRLYDAMADGAGEGQWRFDEGLGLLSRHRLARAPEILKFTHQVHLRTRFGANDYRLPDDRIALHARLVIDSTLEIDTYATHLTDRPDRVPDGGQVNTAQARELAQWIQATSAPDNAVLLGGDLNAVPHSDTILALTEAGLIDIYAAAGQPPGYTNDEHDLDLEGGRNTANQRIDYCFFRPPARGSWRIEAAELFLDHPSVTADGGRLWASDHFGVAVRIALRI
jgi:endonuclease/exonuclease/phosphatase family metal-dependent hydrolase